MDHDFRGQMFGGDGKLALRPEIADGAGQRECYIRCEPMQPAQRHLLRHTNFQPIAIELANRLEKRAVRRAVESPRARACQNLFLGTRGEVADPLPVGDEAGEGTEQSDLVAGVDAITVRHAARPNHFIPAFPGAQARGGETSQLGHLVDLIRAGAGQRGRARDEFHTVRRR